MDLTAALESYASVQSATTAFGNRITNGVDEIHAVFDSPSGRDNLKTTIEARLKTMRVAVNEFLDLERERREEYMARSNALTARLKQLESETNDLRSRLEESQAKASVDVLTGVPNRFALEEQFAKELERARRHARPLSCAVLDLDFFKRINDTYGHAAGDKVLRQVAQLCSQNLRTNDFFARYGGEEFVMLLPETEPDAATLVADKLRESVKKVHFHHAGDPVAVTLSVGVAGLREGDTMTSLFERADKALYEAKQAGRDQVKSAPD
jgi:diguanylate cyclase